MGESKSVMEKNSYRLTLLLSNLIKAYRYFISPCLKPACRFYPSCSEYMLLAVTEWGPYKGFFIGVKRVLRCHPFSKGGVDDIPLKSSSSKIKRL